MLHFALCMSMFVCLEIKIFVFVFVNYRHCERAIRHCVQISAALRRPLGQINRLWDHWVKLTDPGVLLYHTNASCGTNDGPLGHATPFGQTIRF